MKLLLTGAQGQLGREIARTLPAERLTALARAELDIADPQAVAARLDAQRPGLLVNAAAYTAVDRAEDEEEQAFRANAEGPKVLAEACRARGIPLLHVSTDYVFDGALDRPIREDDATNPLGVYGRSKLSGEEAVRAAQPEHIILRIAWVFGALGANFPATMLRLARERDTLRIVDDQHGGPTPTRSVALAVARLAERLEREGMLPWGTYHYAGTPATTWRRFAETIFAEAEPRGLIPRSPTVEAITTAEFPTKAQRPANSVLDTTRAREVLGLEPADWQSELRAVLDEWARDV